jgi:hypothetical protein
VLERDLLKVRIAGQSADLGVGQHPDVGVGLDPCDQILRHGLGQLAPSNDERHPASLVGEVDGGLAGRVAAAHDPDARPSTEPSFELGGRVVHAGDKGSARRLRALR